MNIFLSLLLAVALFAAGAALAEKADRNQPMNIEADTLRYDDLQQTSQFTGNVVITKGSIVIRGERVDVRQDPEGYQYGSAIAAAGKRSYFRQKREGVDEFIEGEAEQIDYDGRADVVVFVRSAVWRRYKGAQLNDETTGERISYHNLTGRLEVDGSAASASGGRVRTLLTPKEAASSAAPAAPPATLRAAPGLPGAKP